MNKVCTKGCGWFGEAEQLIVVKCEKGPHYAKLICPMCEQFQGWLAKPSDDSTKYKRTSTHLDLVRKFGRGFCELCLTKEDKLSGNETLEGHHVVEHQHGGTSDRDNVWIICTSCHKFINWRRTYNRADDMVEKLAEHLTSWKNR